MKCVAGSCGCHLSSIMFIIVAKGPTFLFNLPFSFRRNFVNHGHSFLLWDADDTLTLP